MQSKLKVLGKAGLAGDDFANTDTAHARVSAADRDTVHARVSPAQRHCACQGESSTETVHGMASLAQTQHMPGRVNTVLCQCAVFSCFHTTGCEAYSFTSDGCGLFNVDPNLEFSFLNFHLCDVHFQTGFLRVLWFSPLRLGKGPFTCTFKILTCHFRRINVLLYSNCK